MGIIKCLDEAWWKLQIIMALFCWLHDARSEFRSGYFAHDQNLPSSSSFPWLKIVVFGTKMPCLFHKISTFFAIIFSVSLLTVQNQTRHQCTKAVETVCKRKLYISTGTIEALASIFNEQIQQNPYGKSLRQNMSFW